MGFKGETFNGQPGEEFVEQGQETALISPNLKARRLLSGLQGVAGVGK